MYNLEYFLNELKWRSVALLFYIPRFFFRSKGDNIHLILEKGVTCVRVKVNVHKQLVCMFILYILSKAVVLNYYKYIIVNKTNAKY